MPSVSLLIDSVGRVVQYLLILMVGVALVIFFWGLAKFIFKASDKDAKEQGRNRMVWGLIALFVMVSVWGIIAWIQGDFGFWSGPVIIQLPTL